MTTIDFAPTVRRPRHGGPRTKRAARRLRNRQAQAGASPNASTPTRAEELERWLKRDDR